MATLVEKKSWARQAWDGGDPPWEEHEDGEAAEDSLDDDGEECGDPEPLHPATFFDPEKPDH